MQQCGTWHPCMLSLLSLAGRDADHFAFIIDHDVVGATLRHLAKAEVQSPRGPPSAAALSVAS